MSNGGIPVRHILCEHDGEPTDPYSISVSAHRREYMNEDARLKVPVDMGDVYV
jgi:hypothetical protein